MEELAKIINDLEKKVNLALTQFVVRKITIPSDGYFIVQKVTSDPVAPYDGQLWLNTTTNLFKIRINGITKVITVT